MKTLTQSAMSVFLLLAVTVAIRGVSSERLYIVTSPDSPCPGTDIGEPCLTLEQYASNPSRHTNVTLELEPGQHNLRSTTLSVSTINSFRIITKNEATVTCTGSSSYIDIISVENVQISGLTFIDCSVSIRDSNTSVFEESRVLRSSTLSIESTRNATVRRSFFTSEGQYSLRVAESSSALIERCTFADTYIYSSLGGSIWGSNSNITIAHSTFTNISGISGALYIERDRNNIVIDNSTFTANSIGSSSEFYYFTASNGVVNVRRGNVMVRGCNFTNNSVSGNGGVFSGAVVQLYISESIFVENTAGRNGGVVYISGGESYEYYSELPTVAIDNSIFTNNVANESGGVMHVSVATVYVQDSAFDSNVAMFGGGGVLYSDRQSSEIAIEGSSFTNNTAAYCGVLEADSQYNYTITVARSSFRGNRALGRISGRNEGGVVCTRSSSLFFHYSAFNDNYAKGDAGVAYVDESDVTTLLSSFVNNTARRDGGVFANKFYPTRYNIDSSSFRLNRAGDDGGVLFVGRAGSQVSVISGTRFELNSARNRGGVAVTLGSEVFINQTSIIHNTAYWGGVLRACNGEVTTPSLDLFVAVDPTNPLCHLYYESNTTIPLEDTREVITTTEASEIVMTRPTQGPLPTAGGSDSYSSTDGPGTTRGIQTERPVTANGGTQGTTGDVNEDTTVPPHNTGTPSSFGATGDDIMESTTTDATTTTQDNGVSLLKLPDEGVWHSLTVLSLCISIVVLLLVVVLYVAFIVYTTRKKADCSNKGCCNCQQKDCNSDSSQMTNLLTDKDSKESIP